MHPVDPPTDVSAADVTAAVTVGPRDVPRLRPAGHRLGSRRAEGGDRGGQARQAGRGRRAPRHDRRRLHADRHDPVEDPARGRPLPHRLRDARALRRELPGQAGHHRPGPARAHQLRHRPRGGGDPRAAAAQPGRPAQRRRPVRRRARRRGRRRAARGEHQTVTAAKIVVATGTRPARPPQVEFDDRRVVDSDGILAMEQHPGQHGRRRRRGDRHRVRLDVRRARHPRHRRRAPARRCSTSATPRSSSR